MTETQVTDRDLARCGPLPRWVIYAGATLLACALYRFADRQVLTWMLAHNSEQPWATIRQVLRPFGAGVPQAIVLVLVTIFGLWMDRPKLARAGKWLLLAFAITVILTTALKWSVRRPRPGSMDAPRPTLAAQIDSGEWHSFPSGDVAATTTIVVMVFGLTGRARRWRWVLLLPILVAVQRIAAGRHFPADVVAGAMLGAWVAQQTLRRIPPYRDWRSVPRRKAKVIANDPA